MGWHFWYTSSSPPTKITSCPCSACTVLPETGASSTDTPLLRAASCTRRELRGFTVLISITIDPARAPASAPSGPNITCSSAASFATLENTMSTPVASCFAVAATLAPRCCKGRVRSGVRLYTATSWLAASNRPAMRLPIAPTPIKPTRIVSPQPLWILVCPIEMMGRFVQLVFPVARGERRAAEQRLHDRVEPEPVRPRAVEHPQVNGGTLVAGETDVADLAGALRRRHRFPRAVRAEHALRICHSDHFVELHEVDAVGLQPAQ